ncbi:hypothetical protein [Vibrio parahaemolyticus]|uniref:hypothetical protein n=1 Tax=Vibrio parahaemolyticus TaxID=670 RepID=UPI0031CC7FFF
MSALTKEENEYSLNEYIENFKKIQGMHESKYKLVSFTLCILACYAIACIVDGLFAFHFLITMTKFEVEWVELIKGLFFIAVCFPLNMYLEFLKSPKYAAITECKIKTDERLKDIEYMSEHMELALKESFERIGDVRINELLSSYSVGVLNDLVSGKKDFNVEYYYILQRIFDEIPKYESISELKEKMGLKQVKTSIAKER